MTLKKNLILFICLFNIQNIMHCNDNSKAAELYTPYMPAADQWYNDFAKQLTQEQLVSIASAINQGLEYAVSEFNNANQKIAEKFKTTFEGLKSNIESSPAFKQAIDQMSLSVAPSVQKIDAANKELFGRIFAYYKKIDSLEKNFKFPQPQLIKDKKVDEMAAKLKKTETVTEPPKMESSTKPKTQEIPPKTNLKEKTPVKTKK